MRGCAGQFIARACCSSTTTHGRPSRGARALSGSCKLPGIDCAGWAALPDAAGGSCRSAVLGTHPPCAPDSRRPSMLARKVDLLPSRGQGASRCRQSPSNTMVTNSRFTHPSAGEVGGMWSSGRPMTRHRLQCRVMLPALRQSRKRAPPSITSGKDARHPNPDNRHSAVLAWRGRADSRPPRRSLSRGRDTNQGWIDGCLRWIVEALGDHGCPESKD